MRLVFSFQEGFFSLGEHLTAPANTSYHLTASGAVRGGHLVENVILRSLVLFISAAGKPNR
jgi:hypothetical protein